MTSLGASDHRPSTAAQISVISTVVDVPERRARRPAQHHRMPHVIAPDDPRLVAALELADRQAQVVSRRQLYRLGLTRWEICGQIRARRWQRVGDQAGCTHSGPLEEDSHRWAAVFQGGPRACLDGAASLVASGLERYTVDRI